jgi:hypothetical protein
MSCSKECRWSKEALYSRAWMPAVRRRTWTFCWRMKVEESAKEVVLAEIEEAMEMKPEEYGRISRTSFLSLTKSPVKRTLLRGIEPGVPRGAGQLPLAWAGKEILEVANHPRVGRSNPVGKSLSTPMPSLRLRQLAHD